MPGRRGVRPGHAVAGQALAAGPTAVIMPQISGKLDKERRGYTVALFRELSIGPGGRAGKLNRGRLIAAARARRWRYRAQRGMGGARGSASGTDVQGEARYGGCPLYNYGFLFAGRMCFVGRIKENPRGDVLFPRTGPGPWTGSHPPLSPKN